MKKLKRPKTVTYVLIPQETEIGRPMYELLYSIIDEHHDELSKTNVRVALAWSLAWKADVDGRITLGKCKKASDLDRELAPFDFVILLNRDFWLNSRVTEIQRRALLDHELMHAAVAYDENGDIKTDDRGRTCYRVRKHDLEEFRDIAARYGCWKSDIESFAIALRRAENTTSGSWVGYTALQETLREIGVVVDKHVIAEWQDAERREVMTWALLRAPEKGETVNAAFSPSMPACLAAVVNTSSVAAPSH